MVFDRLNGILPDVRVTLSGAEPFRALGAAADMGVKVTDAFLADECTLSLSVFRRDIPALRRCCERLGIDLDVRARGGLFAFGRRLRRRAAAASLLALSTLMCVLSRAFIWNISVEGNESVPTGAILAALSECGVDTGRCWLGFTSDSIRNEVILRCPDIAWLTVNVHGSRAEVVVRERIKKPEMIDPRDPASVIASRDGFITRVQALYGTPETKAGAAVCRGETLISGVVAGIEGNQSFVHACGEVWARTFYDETACVPEKKLEKIYTGEEKSRWSLKIGGYRINFFGKYSNLEQHCDKIYTEYKAGIGSLFSLPLSIVRERLVYYEINPSIRGRETESLLRSNLKAELPDEVISENFSFYRKDGLIFAELRAECTEQIGVTQPLASDEKGLPHD